MKKDCFTKRRFSILAVCMMFVLAVSLCVSSNASAQGQGQAGLPALQAEIDDLQLQIDTIELTPGPQGDKGDTGDTGADGTTPWSDTTDGYNTISTIGSIKIGDDYNSDYCDTRNEGTIRYNTVTNIFEGCDGTEWVSLSSQGSGDVLYAIGDTGPAGGKVFYITDGGLHGLEAAPVDQSSAAPWGCYGTSIAGADGTAVGTGAQNTADILAWCGDTGTAAKIADAYRLGGYNDWFLPSRDELNLMYQQKAVVGGFASNYYWSSSENISNSAWSQNFFNGNQNYFNKNDPL